MTCESRAVPKELKQAVQTADQAIEMRSPNTRQKSITIVGLPSMYEKEELIRHIVSQNSFIRNFTTVNKIEDPLTVHIIKPLRNKPDIFYKRLPL